MVVGCVCSVLFVVYVSSYVVCGVRVFCCIVLDVFWLRFFGCCLLLVLRSLLFVGCCSLFVVCCWFALLCCRCSLPLVLFISSPLC